MINKPLVSIFIPYYNDKFFLRAAINSILEQNYQNFELILLNHASTDTSRDIAHSYKDTRIKHFDIPYNLGYGGSGILLQEFLNIAKGKYIKPFYSDDIIIQDGLEHLVNYMEKNSNIDFLFGDIKYINKKGKYLKDSWFKSKVFFNINDTEVEPIKKYSKGKSVLPYFNITINSTFVMMFDMSLWLELLCAGYKIGFINKSVCKYRIHSE